MHKKRFVGEWIPNVKIACGFHFLGAKTNLGLLTALRWNPGWRAPIWTAGPEWDELLWELAPLCKPPVFLVYVHLLDVQIIIIHSQHLDTVKQLPFKKNQSFETKKIRCCLMVEFQCQILVERNDACGVVMIIKLGHAGEAVVGWLHISGCCKTMNAQIRSRNEAKIETWESSVVGCLSWFVCHTFCDIAGTKDRS